MDMFAFAPVVRESKREEVGEAQNDFCLGAFCIVNCLLLFFFFFKGGFGLLFFS